jgi:hypothetical protein
MAKSPGVARIVLSSSWSSTPEGTLSMRTLTVSLTRRNAPHRISPEMTRLAAASARYQPNPRTKSAAAMAATEPSASAATCASAALVLVVCE